MGISPDPETQQKENFTTLTGTIEGLKKAFDWDCQQRRIDPMPSCLDLAGKSGSRASNAASAPTLKVFQREGRSVAIALPPKYFTSIINVNPSAQHRLPTD